MTRRSEIAKPGFDDLDTIEKYPELVDGGPVREQLNQIQGFMHDEIWRIAMRGENRRRFDDGYDHLQRF